MGVKDVLMPPRSAYVHIPFCHRRCFYCDFAVVPLGDRARGSVGPGSSSINAYLKLLHKEVSLCPYGPPLATVYLGGGTPSLLTPQQISSLLENLRNHFGFQQGAEVTLEMDPASFDREYLQKVLEIGINRVSLGGQSFDDTVLAGLGRRHTHQHLINACRWLNNAKVRGDLVSWNLDLLQGLPGQDLSSWINQLEQALETRAPHLSIYELSIESGTVFEWKQKRGELFLPDEELASEMMILTSELLRKAGFSHYEISNYAIPGHASRHNRVYWSGAGWWGFGLGATSSPWGQRFARPRTRNSYDQWIKSQEYNGLESSLISSLAKELSLEDQILIGLRRKEGVNLIALSESWGWNNEESASFLELLKIRWKSAFEKGWIQQKGRRFFLSDPRGMMISNQVLIEVIRWWESLPLDAVDLSSREVLPRKVLSHLVGED